METDIVTGWSNPPLSEEGQAQAKELAEALKDKKLDWVRTSDLARALDTARLIRDETGAPIVETTDALRPWHLGPLEGQPSADVEDQLRELIANPDELPDKQGESFNQFKTRFLGYVAWLLQDEEKEAAEYEGVEYATAVVTHSRNLEMLSGWLSAGKPDDFSIDIEPMLGNGFAPASVYFLGQGKDALVETDVDGLETLEPGLYFIRHAATEWDTNKGVTPMDFANIKTSEDAKKAGLPTFKIWSDGPIKAYKDADGKRHVSLTASSDAVDLVGDMFSRKALQQMSDTAKGMTLFLNHSYQVPEDVFGAVQIANVGKKSVFNKLSGADEERWCLTYDGLVTEKNQRAVDTHEQMMEGIVTLGASVSVLITDKTTAKDGTRIIDDVINLECSIVGIPCNPTTWVMGAGKALLLGGDPEDRSVCGWCKQIVTKKHFAGAKGVPTCKNATVRGVVPTDKPTPKPIAFSIDSVTDDAKSASPFAGIEAILKEIGLEADLSAIKTADELEALMDQVAKAVSGAAGLPLAARDAKWDASAADKRVRTWAGAEETPNAKYAKAFFYKDADNTDKFTGYKLGFADIVDDKLTAVPKGIFAVAGVLNGARGGVDIPDADKDGIKKKVEKYYSAMAKEFDDDSIKVPWADDKDAPRGETKDFFTDEFKEQTESIWFLADILICGFWDLCCDIRWGEPPDDTDAELAEGLKAFSDQCMAVLGPKLKQMATDREEGSNDIGYYSLFADKGFLNPESMLTAYKALVTALNKEGRRNSKEDAEKIQAVHDYSMELGAKCKDVEATGGDDADDTSMKDDSEADADADKAAPLIAALEDATGAIKTLQAEKTSLETQLAATKALEGKIAALEAENERLTKENEEWQAISVSQVEAIESILRSPLPV